MTVLFAILQFLAFDAAWFASVWGGANGWPWLGLLPALGVLGLHLALSRAVLWAEVKLAFAIVLFGILLEAGLMGAGLIRYAGTQPGQMLPPVWIVALWIGFASIPNGSLTWLRGRIKLQMLLGLLFGPLAYWTGAKMGAATLADPTAFALLGIGIAWLLAFPTLMLLAETISPGRVSPSAP
ncbi:DUF2878 domain-containing protein [Aestuariivirga sp.]|uniref:DUF2878 domain-containing protein n=1 Tax=Aestuariivirga sp. TaxID=2650926 RepID=UPI003BACB394